MQDKILMHTVFIVLVFITVTVFVKYECNGPLTEEPQINLEIKRILIKSTKLKSKFQLI